MKRTAHTFVLLVTAASFAVACGGKKDGDSGKKPPKPADGTPIATEFVSITGEGKKMAGKIKVHNYTDKKITGLRFNLRYLDASGKELKTFPWSVMAPTAVKANGSATHTVGAFLPPETKKVDAVPRQVTFGDGTKWDSKKK